MEHRQVKAHPVTGGLRLLSLPAFLARFGLLMLASGLAPFLSSPAQQQAPSEYEVKAAYLYYFGKFVTWPLEAEASGNSFVICVLGEDPFGPALDRTIVGESIRGTNVVVRRV
ncbi:MAG: YfiR family protein, partial [Candidatus Acidiferrales bacterium]